MKMNYTGPEFSSEVLEELNEFVKLAVGTPDRYQYLITGSAPDTYERVHKLIISDIREAKLRTPLA